MRQRLALCAVLTLASACGGSSPPPPSATHSTLAVAPGSAFADGRSTVTAIATILDEARAPVPGATVVFAATGTGNTWTPASAVTDASGIASATLASTTVGVQTASVTANGVAISTTQSVTFSGLVISEVGNWYYDDVPAWLEVYNGTASTVNLSSYALRALGIDPRTGAEAGVTTFALPELELPSGAFAIVVGKTVAGSDYDGPLYLHVATAAGTVPSWFGSGFVELLKDGATVDFVRFGSSTSEPVTPGTWSGAGATAFPTATPQFNFALARRPLASATHTAADWQQVNFGTPGGPNDVAPGAVDSDGDGIPDSAKLAGGTFAGLDLHAMGARPGQRDVFIEVDGMDSTDPGIVPVFEALAAVVEKFRTHGVYLHLDAGSRYSATIDPALYNLGQKLWKVPFAACITFPPRTGCAGNLFTYKARYMDVARRGIFHYALFGSTQETSGLRGSSGRGNIRGPNFLVTLGGWGLTSTPGTGINKLVNVQASTFMHEFGHNLGLLHGGNENQNYKPNYFSIMNYLYQLNGLSDVTQPSVGDRYFYENFNRPGNVCLLEASPCSAPGTFRMDFSDGTSAAIDEASVTESLGIGRMLPFVPIDFNDNGLVDDGYRRILNPLNEENLVEGRNVINTLRDFDDWSNLKMPFQSGSNWLYGILGSLSLVAPWSPSPPFADHSLEVAREWAPSPRYFDSLAADGTR